MSPDTLAASHIVVSRVEPDAVRTLPLITRALRTHFCLFVDPFHGWLELEGQDIAEAFCANAPGVLNTTDLRRVTRAITKLRDRGVLVRCRVGDAPLGHITVTDGRPIELSPWLEDDQGAYVVFPDWVPDRHRLSRPDIQRWHQARRDRMAPLVSPPDAQGDEATPTQATTQTPIPATATTENSHAGC